MGKLMDRLQKQLKSLDCKKDAEDCIEIYNWIKGTDPEGRVWESRWTPMVNVRWVGTYPNSNAIYKPNTIGYALLESIKLKSLTDINTELLDTLSEIMKMCDGNIENENNIWHICNKAISKFEKKGLDKNDKDREDKQS